jgi:hypothetical protein
LRLIADVSECSFQSITNMTKLQAAADPKYLNNLYDYYLGEYYLKLKRENDELISQVRLFLIRDCYVTFGGMNDDAPMKGGPGFIAEIVKDAIKFSRQLGVTRQCRTNEEVFEAWKEAWLHVRS